MAEAVLDRLNASNIFDLSGAVAVVTGGNTGIGLMISSTLVANGATVYVIGKEQSELDKVARKYNDAVKKRSGKGKMVGIQADVRQKSEASRIAADINSKESHGITVLFNNAGILAGSWKDPKTNTAEAYKEAHFDAITQDDFNNVLNTNAIGPYWFTFAFLPLLEKWKLSASEGNEVAKKFAPQVIMTSSMNGWTKDSNTAGRSYPYLFSKSAIGHATSSLAHELLPLGIRVNGIAPGWFSTPMGEPGGSFDEAGNWRHGTNKDRHPNFEVPLQTETGGTNRDMGTLALFLVANWYVNGETVLIDGGTLLKHPSSY